MTQYVVTLLHFALDVKEMEYVEFFNVLSHHHIIIVFYYEENKNNRKLGRKSYRICCFIYI